jgi:hypothetical protein
MKTAIVALGVALGILVVSPSASALVMTRELTGGDIGFINWPAGTDELVKYGGLVYAYEWDAPTFGSGIREVTLFFEGDHDDFNEMLRHCARTPGSRKLAGEAQPFSLRVTLHPGQGNVASSARSLSTRKRNIPFDWTIRIVEQGTLLPPEKRDEQTSFIGIGVWVGGQVELGKMEIPEDIPLESGGEIERFIADHEKKRTQPKGAEAETSALDTKRDPEAPAASPKVAVHELFVVLNRAALEQSMGDSVQSVLDSCNDLVNRSGERILDAGIAYSEKFKQPLSLDRYPSDDATEKARWLRGWLASRVPLGSTIVLLGDEKSIPTWQIRLGSTALTTDSLYSDLDGDGVPETAVSRILGSPDSIIRQLQGKKDYGRKALILCSEDTRIHMETRAFGKSMSRLGYDVAIRGAPNEESLVASDFIVHFGHGSPRSISNRFGETFVSSANLPPLPRSPIVFVDGCGTLPVGSPLLNSFLEKGASAYVGSTATVQGMIPARFTNELVEHFLRILAERPDFSLPQILTAARAAYLRGHPGLDAKLRQLAATGRTEAQGDEATHLLTVAEWVHYGDPRATIPSVGHAVEMSRELASIAAPVRLDHTATSWRSSFALKEKDGRAVLALYADIPLAERADFRFSLRQNDNELSLLDAHRDTVYQNLGEDCRGGYVSGEIYRARFLVPLRSGPVEQHIEVQLTGGSSAILTPGTQVDLWPPDFEEKIGLRHAPRPRPPGRIAEVSTVAEPVAARSVKAEGFAKLVPADTAGFQYLDLQALFNRPHSSAQVGGGDNASFRTWFPEDHVVTEGIPFLVRRDGKNVLVSANNTQNLYEIKGIDASARSLHFLVWGYNRPNKPAALRITFTDGSLQECDLPLSEWTQAQPPFAFDFENTVAQFQHAAVAHQAIAIADPTKKISSIISASGSYGLIAITLEQPDS